MDDVTVQMTVSLQGGRSDGRDWPPFLGIIDIPRPEAEHLIAGGLAQVPGADEVQEEPTALSDSDLGDEEADDDFESGDFDSDEPALEVKRKPYENESRTKWIAYAVSRGMAPEEAHKATKNSLVKKYKDQ